MVTIKSNINAFSALLANKKRKAQGEMGVYGLKNIDALTPVDKGLLKSKNRFSINNSIIYFENPVDYAPYVEYGTWKMPARPFMRNGVTNSRMGFIRILISNLGV